LVLLSRNQADVARLLHKGNQGTGLGIYFAKALHANLHTLFADFGAEKITKGSHIEKLCLIRDGVGRDNISDFVTNLIKDFLCRYTEQFTEKHLTTDQKRIVGIQNAIFNYSTEIWEPRRYTLPWTGSDFVILSPKDLLTRDENWINKTDLLRRFDDIPPTIPDAQLREQVSNYFNRVLVRHPRREPNQREYSDAARWTILEYPELIDYYIRLKEDRGDGAVSLASEKVRLTESLLILQLRELQKLLYSTSNFYSTDGGTYEEARKRVAYLKDVIENKGGHKLFYQAGNPIQREQDLQIAYRLVWFGSPSDVSTEVNDGRGPADFKISRGASDKTIVEMKLAKNTHLKQNLEKQVPIYQAASGAKQGIKVILFFTAEEEERVATILTDLKLTGHRDIILIDARADNKPSGSKA
jgi:hypothetical protein